MVTLLAMLNEDRFPGSIDIENLVTAVQHVCAHQSRIANDFGLDVENRAALRQSLELNPINAWVVGAGTGHQKHFHYEGDVFSSALSGGPSRSPSEPSARACRMASGRILRQVHGTNRRKLFGQSQPSEWQSNLDAFEPGAEHRNSGRLDKVCS